MNFFEAQERARKATKFLVFWFIAALLLVVFLAYAVVVLIWNFALISEVQAASVVRDSGFSWWHPQLFAATAVVVSAVVVCGSLVKTFQLSAGGKVVARDLNGRAVDPSTMDLRERQLLNVVEEMAIASGVPVPEVWILDEERGINAFAAGTDPSNAVIGVTSGTLNRLSRAELQGVVAHEFSHILNGDMKLNMRLIGWIFGLVMLSGVGTFILRGGFYVRGDSHKRSGDLRVMALGAATWLIGSIGILGARMIQAAISRQREYLADASAVQFTRDTNGIQSALQKIGGFSLGGMVRASGAGEARHLFFSSSSFGGFFRTHPPLEKRIRALNKRWDGTMLKSTEKDSVSKLKKSKDTVSGFDKLEPLVAAAVLSSLGDSESLDLSVGERIRADLLAGNIAQFNKGEAKFLLLGLLLGDGEEFAEELDSLLVGNGFQQTEIQSIRKWASHFENCPTSQKLAVVDLSLSWLRKMSQSEAVRFIEASKSLIAADQQIDLFEFMLQRVIERHVEIGLGLRPVPKIRFQKLVQLENEVAVILSTFAHLADDEQALNEAATEYREHTGRELPRVGQDLKAVGIGLEALDAATPLMKQRFLRLCSLVVTSDNVVNEKELELLRATAEAIAAPMPAMVQKLV